MAETKVTNYELAPEISSYSTSEVDTGAKWVDGSAIYKKTVNFGALPNNTTKAVAHGVTNLSYIIKYEALTKRTSDGIIQVMPRANVTSIANQSTLEFSATNISVQSVVDLSSYNVTYVTIYYVKT